MRKLLLVTRLYNPHVGGVEKQITGFCRILVNRGYEVTIITEKYDSSLENRENIQGVNIIRISYPKIPLMGLIVIWIKITRYFRVVYASDFVHAFGSFIWIWPIRVIFFWKRYFVTFYGWEGKFPIPLRNKILRKIAKLLSEKSISDAGFIEKYYDVKTDKVRYASFEKPKKEPNSKDKSYKVVYVGRLDEDTGLKQILKGISVLKGKVEIDFCGDGALLGECIKYGNVHGFVDPEKYFRRSMICLSPGHTSIIESFFYKCLVVTTYDNPLKKDYLLMTPFKDWIVVEKEPEKLAEKIKYYLDHPEKAKPMIDAAYEWVQGQTWEKMADTYEELWGIKESKV